MKLLISIILATVLGIFLSMIGEVGIIIGFGILAGILFRGVYLLNDLSKRLSKVAPALPISDKVKKAYEDYLREKEINS
ncbi:hypothetical protein AN960_22330 [Bacillus sp. FJAT-25509]|uniref:hypothetical protein n=1 Tax=Bacillaceae TaxID=186817 RepID=UPI0006F221EF|nr:hypothetical protein [Bacillus sp. FJAT-25509]KQL32991.1 hypothetical protein AN960_22330 [Bacillus sp. FJAT-25509]